MRHLYALLTTLACLVVSFAVYAFVCWVLGFRPTEAGFALVLVANLMFQFYSETFKRIDEEK